MGVSILFLCRLPCYFDCVSASMHIPTFCVLLYVRLVLVVPVDFYLTKSTCLCLYFIVCSQLMENNETQENNWHIASRFVKLKWKCIQDKGKTVWSMFREVSSRCFTSLFESLDKISRFLPSDVNFYHNFVFLLQPFKNYLTPWAVVHGCVFIGIYFVTLMKKFSFWYDYIHIVLVCVSLPLLVRNCHH